jgi:DNA modification methylase
LKTLGDESIDCIITSPPYFQLRRYEGIPDYIWDEDENCEHEFTNEKCSINNISGNPEFVREWREKSSLNFQQGFCIKCGAWKGQLGLEPNYNIFLNHLLQIMAECKRVLKSTGTMWINLGDSYSTNSGNMGVKNRRDWEKVSKGANRSMNFRQNKGGPPKNLMLIPHRFAIRCCDELGLILRNDLIWAKVNALPESVKDRFSKKHEYVFFFVKSQEYYFDLDSIRENHKKESIMRAAQGLNGLSTHGKAYGFNPDEKFTGYNNLEERLQNGDLRMVNGVGKNPGDVSDFWDIPIRGKKGNHYAKYNSALVDRPIWAGCPKGGVILDPFCGSGTTLVRGIQLGRNVIGIDGSEIYSAEAQNELNEALELRNNSLIAL